jgi:hypothetical protein
MVLFSFLFGGSMKIKSIEFKSMLDLNMFLFQYGATAYYIAEKDEIYIPDKGLPKLLSRIFSSSHSLFSNKKNDLALEITIKHEIFESEEKECDGIFIAMRLTPFWRKILMKAKEYLNKGNADMCGILLNAFTNGNGHGIRPRHMHAQLLDEFLEYDIGLKQGYHRSLAVLAKESNFVKSLIERGAKRSDIKIIKFREKSHEIEILKRIAGKEYAVDTFDEADMEKLRKETGFIVI